MKRLVFLLLVVFASLTGRAQTEQDTSLDVQLKEIRVTARWKSDTDRYRYNQKKHYVKMVLPYVDAATKVFKEIDAKLEEPGVRKKDKRKYVNAKEDEVRIKFEDKVKSLNDVQGALLVKLIARQTKLNIYKTLKEFKNPFTAVKWQTWARLNGMNLDKKYNPGDEPDLELIMDELGYPLPEGYIAEI
jgi:hypothetical protein